MSIVNESVTTNHKVHTNSSADVPRCCIWWINGVNLLDQFWWNNLRVSDLRLRRLEGLDCTLPSKGPINEHEIPNGVRIRFFRFAARQPTCPINIKRLFNSLQP